MNMHAIDCTCDACNKGRDKSLNADKVLLEAKATYHPFSTESPEAQELTEVPIYADCLRDLIALTEQLQKRVAELEEMLFQCQHCELKNETLSPKDGD